MKTISPVESKFVRQFQDMVRAFQIENQVVLSNVTLEWLPDGTTNYLIETEVLEEPENPETE